MTKSTENALRKYGEFICYRAYEMNRQGEGANTIRLTLQGAPNTVRAVDACINAGRELATRKNPGRVRRRSAGKMTARNLQALQARHYGKKHVRKNPRTPVDFHGHAKRRTFNVSVKKGSEWIMLQQPFKTVARAKEVAIKMARIFRAPARVTSSR